MTRRIHPCPGGMLSGPVTVAAGQTRATTADLAGTIVDQSSAVLPGAHGDRAERRHEPGSERHDRRAGPFSDSGAPAWHVRVRAELPGFAPRTLEDVVLSLGSLIDVRLTLNVAGGAGDRRCVAADAPVIDTQRTAVSTVIAQDRFDRLPINGRNFIGFSLLAPGVATDRTPQQGASGTSGLSFAGQRARSNNITVDGLDNNDSAIGSRARDVQPGSGPRIPGAHQFVFGRVRQGVWRRREHRDQERHEHDGGQPVLLLRDGALNSKDHFERFNPAGHPSIARRPRYSQKQYGATLGGALEEGSDVLFPVVRAARHRRAQLRDDRRYHNVTFLGQNFGTPAAILRRAGFAIETGHVPYDIRSTSFWEKSIISLNPSHSLSARINWANDLDADLFAKDGIAKHNGNLMWSCRCISEDPVRRSRPFGWGNWISPRSISPQWRWPFRMPGSVI